MILPTDQQDLLFPQSLYFKYWQKNIKSYRIFVMQIVPELCLVFQCPLEFQELQLS